MNTGRIIADFYPKSSLERLTIEEIDLHIQCSPQPHHRHKLHHIKIPKFINQLEQNDKHAYR